MQFLIPNFTLGMEQRLNPFNHGFDPENKTFMFIHLTGRGGFSYLFPEISEQAIVAEAERTIPMGYTQIWVLEWIKAVQPDFAKKTRPAQRRSVEKIGHGTVRENISFVLFGENGICFGSTDSIHTAREAAGFLAVEKKTRIVIGLLRVNISWH